ncbi:hypothetical protein HYV86_05325 [Candidatus Woesearchaeota archaeon]|nr:hypothetical protein [Candidatus Woesearchaeota archaeon]
MKKKGQISVFMVLGLVVLLVMFIFIGAIQQKHSPVNSDQQVQLAYDTALVEQTVSNCVEDVAARSLITVGYYGGKDRLVGPYYDDVLFDSNYLFYNDTSLMPNATQVEDTLELMVQKRVVDCIHFVSNSSSSSSSFSRNTSDSSPNSRSVETTSLLDYNSLFEGIEVTPLDPPTVDVNLAEEHVLFTVNWPVEVRHGEMAREISDFSPSPFMLHFKSMIDAASLFVSQLAVNNGTLDALSLVEQNVTYDISLLGNDTYLVLITDNSSLINYRPLGFLFAGQFNAGEIQQ